MAFQGGDLFARRRIPDARAVSSDAVTMRRPSGLNAALVTLSVWPSKAAICLPVAASQMRAVLSADAVTIRRPSGLNAALSRMLVWPSKAAICLPVAASQMRAVLSADAVTMRRPSGLNAALRTLLVWPSKAAICLPVAASQRRARVVVRRGHDPPAIGAERRAQSHCRYGLARRRSVCPSPHPRCARCVSKTRSRSAGHRG